MRIFFIDFCRVERRRKAGGGGHHWLPSACALTRAQDWTYNRGLRYVCAVDWESNPQPSKGWCSNHWETGLGWYSFLMRSFCKGLHQCRTPSTSLEIKGRGSKLTNSGEEKETGHSSHSLESRHMVEGAPLGLLYRMSSVNAHFPINVSVQESGALVEIWSFLYKKKSIWKKKSTCIFWDQALFVQYLKPRKLVALNLYQTQLLRLRKPQQLNTRISEKC